MRFRVTRASQPSFSLAPPAEGVRRERKDGTGGIAVWTISIRSLKRLREFIETNGGMVILTPGSIEIYEDYIK